ncbi:MAG TPA: hypothetical protein VK169_15075 [Saprospiraceae bacterium]|nr:hypothetical protein [Saprospiraceae bacterium]
MIHIILKYSSFILILLFAISCTKPTLIGHWKCNKTGLAKALNKNDEMLTAPITEFYDLLKIHPLEFVFSEDGKAKSITTKLSGTVSELSLTVTNNHDGEPSKYQLRDNTDPSNDMIMTLKSLTKNKLEASFDMLDDGMLLDLKMDRIK